MVTDVGAGLRNTQQDTDIHQDHPHQHERTDSSKAWARRGSNFPQPEAAGRAGRSYWMGHGSLVPNSRPGASARAAFPMS